MNLTDQPAAGTDPARIRYLSLCALAPVVQRGPSGAPDANPARRVVVRGGVASVLGVCFHRSEIHRSRPHRRGTIRPGCKAGAALTAYLMEMCGISYALRALFCLMVVWWHADLAAFCLAIMALYNVAPLLLILRHTILFPPGVRELSLCVPVVEGGLCALAYAYART